VTAIVENGFIWMVRVPYLELYFDQLTSSREWPNAIQSIDTATATGPIRLKRT